MKKEVGEPNFWEGSREILTRLVGEYPLGQFLVRQREEEIIREDDLPRESRWGHRASVIASGLSVVISSSAGTLFALSGKPIESTAAYAISLTQVLVTRQAMNSDNDEY